MTRHLFHTPWWLLVGLALIGMVLAYTGNSRQERRLMLAGVGLVVISIILGLISYIAFTDMDRAQLHTRQIVKAASDQDWDKFRSLLDDQTGLAMTAYPTGNSGGRDALTYTARHLAELAGLKSASIISMDCTQTDTLITVTIEVLSVHESTAIQRPVTSQWQFDWQEYGDTWVLEKITLLRVGNDSDSAMN